MKGPCVVTASILLASVKSASSLWSSSAASSVYRIDQPFSKSFSRLDHAPCVTLFYRNGKIGCGTNDHSVQIGELKYFDGDNLKDDGNEPYVAVMDDYLLKKSSMSILMSAVSKGKIQGLLVLNSTVNNKNEDELFYSPEDLAPQGYGTPSANLNYGNYQYAWNSLGSGIIQYDLHGLPMAYVTDADVSQVLRAEAQQELVKAPILAEFNYYMGPQEMDSIKCLGWNDVDDQKWSPKCLPVGGTSVWAAAGMPPGSNEQGTKPIFVVAAAMDSLSLFHDLVPGANSAACNILTILMAARLIGQIDDKTLSRLNKQIVFGLFQAEAHGFVGSRSFFRDLAFPGFQCKSDLVQSSPRNENFSQSACLNPVYPSLNFAKLGTISGMLAIDQVGVQSNDGLFYVHANENGDTFGAFLSNILKKLSKTNSGHRVYSTSASGGDNGYPYPPTPLTSLLSLSKGSVGGAVLTGYDLSFVSSMPYHSFKDTVLHHPISLQVIAASATIVARAAFASAYDPYKYDADTAIKYAEKLVKELDADDSVLAALANCFLYNGDCADLHDYASTRARNEKAITGFDVGEGLSLGRPPNYYAGVFNGAHGQPFVQVGENVYGRYVGEDFGKKNTDAVGQQPSQLENAVHGLLDDFLGRGSADFKEIPCKKQTDCSLVEFCANDGEVPTCTGGNVCVCSRANFHRALDEALEAAGNKPTGYFVVSEDDAGNSPMYTEPYWSSSVGVRVYRQVKPLPGFLTLVVGAMVFALSYCSSILVRKGLKKEKLY